MVTVAPKGRTARQRHRLISEPFTRVGGFLVVTKKGSPEMLLILSGAYVESELFSEFGKIPPSFLPVGNRRLYCYQIEQVGRFYSDIHLTLPDDFEVGEADINYLKSHRIRLYRTNAGLSLGEAVRAFLGNTETDGRLDILYGDTLITDADFDSTDWLAVGTSDEYYHWYHEMPHDGQPGGTWAGMFSFSDSRLLYRKLSEVGDFITAVKCYGESVPRMERKQVERWLDFGHVHTYFDSKRLITTERRFNHLTIVDGVLTKSSDDSRKMRAEAAWFEDAPSKVKVFLPNLIAKQDKEPVSYSLEYLALATLNELYVFGRLPGRVWKKILSACDTYFRAASLVPVDAPLAKDFVEITYLKKTVDRLKEFSKQSGVDLQSSWTLNGIHTPSLLTMAHEAASATMSQPPVASFIHGDFCFSNIFFDFRSGRLKMVDPRGIDAEGRVTQYGDFRYEIGKLAHSILGLYDFIIARHFSVDVDGNAVSFRVLADMSAPVQDIFLKTKFLGRTPAQWDCYPIMLLLFLSMLPLHVEDPIRQQALMANCLRLYVDWKSEVKADEAMHHELDQDKLAEAIPPVFAELPLSDGVKR
jgi:hypothetical protein